MENKTGQINFTDSFVSRWNHFERSIATFVQKLTKTTRATANQGPMQEFKSTAILPFIKGVSEVLRRCLQQQGARILFKSDPTLRSYLVVLLKTPLN